MNLSIIDILVIILTLVVTFFVGFKSKLKSNSDVSYILAGRKLTTPLFVVTLVATWYGSILGIGEFINQYGTLAWICMGLPYYLSAFVFALFFADKIRLGNSISIPDRFFDFYGKNTSIISAIIILLITLPSAYVLMLGLIIKDIFGFDLLLSLILGTLFSFSIIYNGGFKSDIYSNYVQFILMYLGFVILFFFLIYNFGSPAEMLKAIDDKYIYSIKSDNVSYVFVWFIIALQTFVDPSFFQRCSAAKNKYIAKKGILVSIMFWIVFDFLTLVTGLYSIVYFEIDNPINTYLIMAESILPPFFKGIFISALLATIMSSLNSYGFLSGVTIGYDILKKMQVKIKDITLNRIGLLISGILSIVLAYSIPSIIDIFYKTASLAIPGILIPLLITYSSKYEIRKNLQIYVVTLPFVVSLMYFLFTKVDESTIFQPMFIGLMVSIIICTAGIKKSVNN